MLVLGINAKQSTCKGQYLSESSEHRGVNLASWRHEEADGNQRDPKENEERGKHHLAHDFGLLEG